MAGTLNIPLTTLTVGTRNFPAAGGFTVADTDTQAVLAIDRTVTGGFNSLTSATTAQLTIYQSNDGGATWMMLAADGLTGGIHTMHGGLQENTDDVGVTLSPGTGRLARGQIVISGPSSVAVQGSLTIS